MSDMNKQNIQETDIAIIGMSCQVPGASDLINFWKIIEQGKDCISRKPTENSDEDRVFAASILPNVDLFDPSVFSISDKDAKLMDPQHRLFLKHSLLALDDANLLSAKNRKIGVFASCNINTYLMYNLAEKMKSDSVGISNLVNILHLNASGHLATQAAYRLDLQGPAMSIQTACSSSLTATHVAIQSLLMYECDAAVVGGSSVSLPQNISYKHEVGSVFSKDGYCRPFSQGATGTIFGNGVGTIVLKRASEAIENRDHIYAIIKGSAVNNDGNQKMSFTSPSIAGQKKCILESLNMAGINPETITYLEAHGTGTHLGDPIEIRAATQAFEHFSDQKGFCYLGSIKSNLGHLNAAAGIVGLMKASLTLKNKIIPPLLGFISPNEEIDFKSSPFILNTKKSITWETHDRYPRRAAVTSIGIGGTNANMILEEPPTLVTNQSKHSLHILVWSETSDSRLNKLTSKLTNYLKNTTSDIADVAYTLQNFKKHKEKRRFIISKSIEEAVIQLNKKEFNIPNIDIDNALMESLSLWSKGDNISWKTYDLEERNKVSIPMIVFEEKPYWISHEKNKKTPDKKNIQKKQPLESSDTLDMMENIREIWKESLGINSISFDDDFFDLGGDSLLATQILTKIKSIYSIELTMIIFDNHSTIKKLVEYLEKQIDIKIKKMSPKDIMSLIES